MLIRNSSFREKLKLVIKATRQHARNLATFAFVYKSSMIVLRNLNMYEAGKEGRYDSFLAGLLGGYAVFGRNAGSVSNQVWIQDSRRKNGSLTGSVYRLSFTSSRE